MTHVICMTNGTWEIQHSFIRRLFKAVELSKRRHYHRVYTKIGSGSWSWVRNHWPTTTHVTHWPIVNSDEGNQRTMTQHFWCIWMPQNSTSHVSIVSCGRHPPPHGRIKSPPSMHAFVSPITFLIHVILTNYLYPLNAETKTVRLIITNLSCFWNFSFCCWMYLLSDVINVLRVSC